MSALVALNDSSREGPMSQKGQQATFADALRGFVLNVRSRKANSAAGGQNRSHIATT
jgi:hypothetical protein